MVDAQSQSLPEMMSSLISTFSTVIALLLLCDNLASLVNAKYFEADILGVDGEAMEELAPSEIRSMLSDASNNERSKWPDATIPFKISDSFTFPQQSLINKALADFRKQTCLKFVPRGTQKDYMYITPGPGCSSYVGRAGGMQSVFINMPGCEELGAIQHEIMHALGFYHEQARTDRDNYVEINWENIETSQQSNFQFYDGKTYGQPYDFESILHYKSDAFAIDDKVWTIRPREKYRDHEIGNRKRMSPLDVDKINVHYKCPNVSGTASQTAPATEAATPAPAKPTPAVSKSEPADSEEVELVTKPDFVTTTTTPKRARKTKRRTTVAALGEVPEAAESTPAKAPKSAGESCSDVLVTSCSGNQQVILDAVNGVRRNQNAANMMKVTWDNSLMKLAQQHTDKCDPGAAFDSNDEDWSTMKMANGNGLQNWNATFEYWLKKRSKFPSVCGVEKSDHPQVMWAAMSKIGCGFSPCVGKGGNFFLCVHGPRLHDGQLTFGSQRCSPYLPGDQNGGPCGSCGGANSKSCDDGLCTVLTGN